YNDFLIEWCAADPKRLLPQLTVPFWDLDASISELGRAAKQGHKGIVFCGEPEHFGLPTLTDPHWDRFWAAAQDHDLPVNFHIGGGDADNYRVMHPSVGKHAAAAGNSINFFMVNAKVLSQLTCSGICHRFPRLDFVSVESGVGWLPYALEAIDWQWLNSGGHREHPEYRLLPSEFFRRQIYGSFWFERGSLHQALELLGPDNIMYETDFPHPTSMSPGPASAAINPRDYIEQVLSGLPAATIGKLLHSNAARVYRLQ
ncbi:MAG: amidohydrolase, partial [Alphaproteobacteria bacterium]|nr:amidohydrolase [Alphaproteobacteria bacterium]